MDEDVTHASRGFSIFGPVLGTVLLMIGAHAAGPVTAVAGYIFVVAPATAWIVFVGWRIVRLFRVASIKGDRDYDQRIKLMLSAEHQRSESVTAASRRKHAQRRRAKR
ncbi:MAG: hypothetical protein ACK4VY_08870 [Brevundimonas sp.]